MIVVFAALGGAGVGCQAPREERVSLLRASDIEMTTTEVVQQLAQSQFLAGRTADSPPIVLQPKPMENLSDNRLSAGDQWAAMSRVLLNQGMLDLLKSKSVTIQMPALQTTRLARAGLTVNEPPAQVAPTHLFKPTLRTIVRAAGDGDGGKANARRDTFLVEYEIVEIQSRRAVWTGNSQFSRIARGSLID